MVTDSFTFIAILLFIASSLYFVENHFSFKIFEFLPTIVILYFSIMLLSTFGVFEKSEEINSSYKELKTNLLPAMLFLMLLNANLKEIKKLGFKMLLTFFLASFSISIGFIGMFALMSSYFEPNAWMAFSALSGSWMGGTANMVAIQGALNLPNSAMGYTLLIDSINYAIWVMFLLACVPLALKFNKWSKADSSLIEKVEKNLSKRESKSITTHSLFFLLGFGLIISLISNSLALELPTTSFLTTTTYSVILATTFGIIFSFSFLKDLEGSQTISTILLYFIVALIASRANFYELKEAPLYIFAGFVILFIHSILMILFAKLFKLDLFSIGVASLANIGGVASAPILASAYSKALIPIGILMATLGYIIGTFGGLMVAKVLEIIAIK